MLHWKQIVGMSKEQRATLGVAAMNLACAADLPDAPSERVVHECLDRVRHYARCTAHYTGRRMSEFRSKPEVYDNSEGIFRMVCLVALLQGQFGVRYNPAKIPEDAPLDTADVFIHGALVGDGGTCASLPVLYAAVGCELGYPPKLARAQGAKWGHLFLRWDDPGGERFNIEVNNTGVNAPPDDYYRTGRFAVSPQDERAGCLLQSMAPEEELADFLAGRGHRWLDFDRCREATDAFAWAWTLVPENRFLKNSLVSAMNGWGDRLRKLEPPGFPPMYFTWPPRRYPDSLPQDYERDILCLEAWENILKSPELNGRWWEPMRRGRPLRQAPSEAVIVYTPTRCEIGFRFTEAVRAPRRQVVQNLSPRWYNPTTGRWEGMCGDDDYW